MLHRLQLIDTYLSICEQLTVAVEDLKWLKLNNELVRASWDYENYKTAAGAWLALAEENYSDKLHRADSIWVLIQTGRRRLSELPQHLKVTND